MRIKFLELSYRRFASNLTQKLLQIIDFLSTIDYPLSNMNFRCQFPVPVKRFDAPQDLQLFCQCNR